MKLSPMALLATGLAFATITTLGAAQILRLDLAQMVARTDNTAYGKITAKHVVRIDHPVDGNEMYFTTLTIEGKSLETGKSITVDVSYMGGSIDEAHGSFNSEAPSADDTKIGNRVVCFFKHTQNLGGDFACNEIVGWHGGLYRTFERKGEVIVQGRGDGYAIAGNQTIDALTTQIATLAKSKETR